MPEIKVDFKDQDASGAVWAGKPRGATRHEWSRSTAAVTLMSLEAVKNALYKCLLASDKLKEKWLTPEHIWLNSINGETLGCVHEEDARGKQSYTHSILRKNDP